MLILVASLSFFRSVLFTLIWDTFGHYFILWIFSRYFDRYLLYSTSTQIYAYELGGNGFSYRYKYDKFIYLFYVFYCVQFLVYLYIYENIFLFFLLKSGIQSWNKNLDFEVIVFIFCFCFFLNIFSQSRRLLHVLQCVRQAAL